MAPGLGCCRPLLSPAAQTGPLDRLGRLGSRERNPKGRLPTDGLPEVRANVGAPEGAASYAPKANRTARRMPAKSE